MSMAKSGIANVVGRAEEVRSQHRHRHQHHHQHQHRHHHRHQHQPTLLLISVPLLRPGRVITRVRQLWRWYFQNVDTLIGIATSHDQLRQARPDQWSEWPPSHRAPHTALLLRCTGARVTMISSSRVKAWQQWPRDQTCHIARYRHTVSWKGSDFMSHQHWVNFYPSVLYMCACTATSQTKLTRL